MIVWPLLRGEQWVSRTALSFQILSHALILITIERSLERIVGLGCHPRSGLAPLVLRGQFGTLL